MLKKCKKTTCLFISLFLFFVSLGSVGAKTIVKSCELKRGESSAETDWAGSSTHGSYYSWLCSDTKAGVYMFCYSVSAEDFLPITSIDKKIFVNLGKTGYYDSVKGSKYSYYLRLTSSQGTSTHAMGEAKAY